MNRSAGVIMHISSLPGKFGIGTFGKEAYKFVDFLSRTGLTYWQILPLGPTGYGDSPYQSFSAFAGNPYFIDFDMLNEEGILAKSDYENEDFGQDKESIDYGLLFKTKYKILKKAFVNYKESGNLRIRNEVEAFKKANKKDIGIIVMKPLAGGAIDDAKLAIKYILSKDYIDVVIPGMESIEQVRENVSVLQDTNITKDDELKIQEIRNIMGKRFCRRCEYCLPCPLKINIPQNFLLEGYYARYNLKDWAKERYKSLEVKASACVECGLCETKCPYELPIREMLKEVSSKLG